MDHAAFWKLIDSSREEASGNPEHQMDVLWEKLTRLKPDDIVAFDRILDEFHDRAYTWDLWAAAYIIGGGCSDDGFSDFRGWLISRGKQAYEAALANPNALIDIVTEADADGQIEGFQYVAVEAWEQVTEKSIDDYPPNDRPSPEAPSGEPWSEENVVDRFPELAKTFG